MTAKLIDIRRERIKRILREANAIRRSWETSLNRPAETQAAAVERLMRELEGDTNKPAPEE